MTPTPLPTIENRADAAMELGHHLYDAFWKRNKNPDAPPFEKQATAIREMWIEIASDALRASSARNAALRAEVEIMREALTTAKIELAALLPRPAQPKTEDWPVENIADAACLQKAFIAIRAAIASAPVQEKT